MSNIEDKKIKVAQIIDINTIVINAGELEGIKDNMRFLIYEDGNEIIDPDTNKSLGTLEISKGYYYTEHIQDHMTTIVSQIKRNSLNDISTMVALQGITKAFGNIGSSNTTPTVKIGDYVKIINKIK
ncbi:hypothetical protein ACR780_02100 [Sphingobacterium faecium]|uniref:hypothetical protein n=1 Tax=Sphingobacterium faecium TaxID=34087 RepID=UPI003DA51CDB